MLRSFVAIYGWEPVLWFGVSVAAFFGALPLTAAGLALTLGCGIIKTTGSLWREE